MGKIALLAGLLLVVMVLAPALAGPAVAERVLPVGITDTPTPTPTPTPTVAPPAPPPVVPEGSTLLLVGSSATGLAAYIGLQIRARRRRT